MAKQAAKKPFINIADDDPPEEQTPEQRIDEILQQTLEKRYLSHNGGRCPVCCSTHIEWEGHPDTNNVRDVTAYCVCNDCMSTWMEHYKLAGVSQIVFGGHLRDVGS